MQRKNIVITGGAGFIGSECVRKFLENKNYNIYNIDSLTYAGNLSSLKTIEKYSNYFFLKEDIRDEKKVSDLMTRIKPQWIVHFAAESHVDRSIEGPRDFIDTNILGTYNLLQGALKYYLSLSDNDKSCFRFHHVSTDEVFGSLEMAEVFREDTPYEPNSPYSASKAASDHLVRAWWKTYGLPVTMSHCSNNYGPYQYPEKLIPLVITNALQGKSIPLYGDGKNIRDWLFVEDHITAIHLILQKAKVGSVYNIGGHADITNIEIITKVCEILDDLYPKNKPHSNLITYVKDRPGHDLRYATDSSKLKKDLGWALNESFSKSLEKTVRWYVDNSWWWQPLVKKTINKKFHFSLEANL
jgi:dTDP-glucose 4,6-dehydratase